MNYLSMLGASQSDFITKVFPILRYVLFGIICVCAVVIIVSVLLQSNSSNESGNIITGSQESYYAKNKGSTRDGKLKLITIICSSIIGACAIIHAISLIING